MLRTFFRHYSLYEYSFKPKVELVLMTIPKGGFKEINITTDREMTQSMQGKAFLDKPVTDEDLNKEHQASIGSLGEGAAPGSQNNSARNDAKTESQEDSEIQNIDWDKVGKIYKPDSAIDHIISKEVSRIRQAMEAKVDLQDKENEEKFKKKKWFFMQS